MTTKSVPEMQDIATRKGMDKKPFTILEYNSIKSFIDVSYQKNFVEVIYKYILIT